MKPVFRARNGDEFGTEAEAIARNKLIDAETKFDGARKEYERAFLGTQKTADGVLFELKTFHRYFHIVDMWDMPTLEEVFFHTTNFHLERGNIVVVDWSSKQPTRKAYRVSQLYYHKREAEVALLAAQEEWVQKKLDQVVELRNRLFPVKTVNTEES